MYSWKVRIRICYAHAAVRMHCTPCFASVVVGVVDEVERGRQRRQRTKQDTQLADFRVTSTL